LAIVSTSFLKGKEINETIFRKGGKQLQQEQIIESSLMRDDLSSSVTAAAAAAAATDEATKNTTNNEDDDQIESTKKTNSTEEDNNDGGIGGGIYRSYEMDILNSNSYNDDFNHDINTSPLCPIPRLPTNISRISSYYSNRSN
jgi:ribosomal protein L12E/L44/L45/RPP1/RPP2